MSKKFFITYSGVRVYPSDIGQLSISLVDIAHHLTNTQRFGGALAFDKKYSVAEHSINMARYALQKYDNIELAAFCLLHDATEAYLGDVVSPLKSVLKEYQIVEEELANRIIKRYNLNIEHKPGVDIIDKCILLDEVKKFLPNRYTEFNENNPGLKPLGIRIKGNGRQTTTEEVFLKMCNQLNIRD